MAYLTVPLLLLNFFALAIDFDAEQVFDMDIVFVLSGISSLSF